MSELGEDVFFADSKAKLGSGYNGTVYSGGKGTDFCVKLRKKKELEPDWRDAIAAKLVQSKIPGEDMHHLVKIKYVTDNAVYMQRVEGETLEKYIQENPNVAIEERKRLLAELLYGLRVLHVHGLTHGDLRNMHKISPPTWLYQ